MKEGVFAIRFWGKTACDFFARKNHAPAGQKRRKAAHTSPARFCAGIFVSEVSAAMTTTNFLRGVGMGIAVGAAVGAMVPTRRKRAKRSSAARAIKAVTDVMDNLSDAMGL